jgi:hypothetical protein
MEDDGISIAEVAEKHMAKFTVSYSATPKEISVSFAVDKTTFEPPWLKNGLTVILPVGDGRKVVGGDGAVVESRRDDDAGRKRWHIVL